MAGSQSQQFGDKLRRLRRSRELTQRQLAEQAGLSRSEIQALEHGINSPRLDTLRFLADALNLQGVEREEFYVAADAGTRVVVRAPLRIAPVPTPDVEHGWPGPQPDVLRAGEHPPIPHSPGGRSQDDGFDPGAELGFDSVEDLRLTCAASVQRAVAAIPKYASDLYIARESVRWEFEQFLRLSQPCLLVQGEAGVGKTNLFCDLAQTSAAQAPTLLLQGTMHMSGRVGLWQVIADELGVASGQEIKPQPIVKALDALLRTANSALIIFVDAINENTDVTQLRQSLAYAAEDASGTRIRLCLSCRDVDWRLFEDEARLIRFLYKPQRSGGRARNGVFLEQFTDSELEEAWGKYSAHYHLVGNLTPNLAVICRHPLMLQFLCDAFRGKTVPPDIHRREIFDHYWKEKLHTRRGRATESALYTLVEEMFARRDTEARERDVIALIGEQQYDRLLSEHVILYKRKDRMDEYWVGFTYDAFLEYAIARHLWSVWDWETDPQRITGDLRGLLAAAKDYRVVQGIMVYLLLFLVDLPVLRPIVREFLDELADWNPVGQGISTQEAFPAEGQRWRIFFCDFITKINDRDFAEEFVPVLARLVRDESFPVRWAAGNALGLMAQHASSQQADSRASALLAGLVASEAWQDREVAALATSHISGDLDAAGRVLEQLADDISWRVRRAVGSALDNLCRQQSDACFPLLRRWSGSERWRLRRALAQAKYGLLALRDREASMDLLETLTSDASEDVRWRVVGDLVAMTVYEGVRKRALSLLMTLVTDPVTIVRQQVAFRLPDLYRNVLDECRPILERLVRDADDRVHWETARTLGSFPPEDLTREYLARLEADSNANVRFAAAYSIALLDSSSHRLAELLSASDEQGKLSALREKLARSSRVLKVPEQVANLDMTWKHDRYADIQAVLQEGAAELDTPERVGSLFAHLLQDEDQGIRWALASLLPKARLLDAPRMAEFLPTLLGDSHYWVRREGLSALEQLVSAGRLSLSPELIALVRDRTHDPDPEVRLAALSCACVLREARAAEMGDAVFAGCIDDEDRQVRAFAQSALSAGPDARA